jgi:hypothetical protein
MLDRNPDIRGMGKMALSDANIETQLFPQNLVAEVAELNRDFIREQKQRQKSTPTVSASNPKKGLSCHEWASW